MRNRLGVRVLERLAAALDRRLVPASYYGPAPFLEELPPEFFERRRPMPGIDFDVDRQLAFAEAELGPFIAEYSPPLDDPGEPGRWYANNIWYGPVGGMFAYAMVRRLRPRRIVELGSGFSTLVLAEAARVNRSDGVDTSIATFDPYPSGVGAAGLDGVGELRELRAQDVPRAEFEALGDGDILFIDTSHVVRTGGDVNAMILEVLPTLAPGVHVHFHDIFLPYEVRRDWLEEGRWWTEQYLLQAFLALNPAYEVVLGTHLLVRERRERLQRLMGDLPLHWPSAFWIRRVGDEQGA